MYQHMGQNSGAIWLFLNTVAEHADVNTLVWQCVCQRMRLRAPRCALQIDGDGPTRRPGATEAPVDHYASGSEDFAGDELGHIQNLSRDFPVPNINDYALDLGCLRSLANLSRDRSRKMEIKARRLVLAVRFTMLLPVIFPRARVLPRLSC